MILNTIDFHKNFLGFIDSNEFLPEDFDQFNSSFRLRQLFLNLSNNILKDTCTFNKFEQKKLARYPLKNAFKYKIDSLLPISYIKTFKLSSSFNFCKNSTLIINAYKNRKSTFISSSQKMLKIAKLINLCYVNNQLQLMLDKDLLFHEFVFQKIKKLHKDKKVQDLGDSISIKGKDIDSLKIYTSWKNIEVKKPNIKNELENAIKSIKNENYTQVYLVYPKANDFKRHIPVFVDELKHKPYVIKAIPYSLRSIIR
ncbi:hypothetical protein CP985_05110 [Malaciobacter mytili LMG 24559]|uniref:Uncharacterized protein n=1 Tax=Malaciobacter mytili LMG 24559 TaxID=1032238 RepID=A0AAX2AIC5_9BACT|nr:hypothetical protein [Malaciobacter mytili]AXH15707.1 hypothetical protein AMYT_2161 [Malaciobacter mytili LMG 24559]RXK16107.1 hypothetical protein CP985_05110 [Malaciobacter mytili LMG 24559]